MKLAADQLVVFTPTKPRSVDEFIDFWACRFRDNSGVYEANIGGPHTPKKLGNLFQWKIGVYYKSKRKLLHRHFISRRHEAAALIKKLARKERRSAAAEFLEQFSTCGPIWRIFWLHCWNDGFPMYDQHVHRAMTYILDGKCQELKQMARASTVTQYLDRYIPFFDAFPPRQNRMVDKALWQFGKYLQTGGVQRPQSGWRIPSARE